MRTLHVLLLLSAACWVTPEKLEAKLTFDRPAEDLFPDDTVIETDDSDPLDLDSADTDTDGDPVETELPECATNDVRGVVSRELFSGNTTDNANTFVSDCAEPGTPDDAVFWSPPAPGCWILTTANTEFDASLSLFSTCSEEQSCNDNGYEHGSEPELHIPNATPGDEYIVAIGSHDGAVGAWSLLGEQGTSIPAQPADNETGQLCEGTFHGEMVPPLIPSTPTCGIDSNDTLVLWTPPHAGAWQLDFHADGDASGVLSVHRPCAPEPIECAGPFQAGPQSIVVIVGKGEQLIVRVGRFGGSTGTWSVTATE